MPTIETLMLANHAETQNGLLYMLGGAWSHHWRGAPAAGQPPPTSQIAVAITFLVENPSEASSFEFAVKITSSSGQEAMTVGGNVQVQPAPGMPGKYQRIAVAANAGVQFPTEGKYTLVAEVPGSDTKSVDFWVHDHPTPQQAAGEAAPEPRAPEFGGTGGYL